MGGKWSTVKPLPNLDEEWKKIREMSITEIDTIIAENLSTYSSFSFLDYGISFYRGDSNGWICLDNSDNIANFKIDDSLSNYNRDKELWIHKANVLVAKLDLESKLFPITAEQKLKVEQLNDPIIKTYEETYGYVSRYVGAQCYQCIKGDINYSQFVEFCLIITQMRQKGTTCNCDAYHKYLGKVCSNIAGANKVLNIIDNWNLNYIVGRDINAKMSDDGKSIIRTETTIGVSKEDILNYIDRVEILDHTDRLSHEAIEKISDHLRSMIFELPDTTKVYPS